MQKMNLPEPEFIEERSSFKVIFRNQNSSFVDDNLVQSGAQSGAPSGQQSGQQSGAQSGQQSGQQSGAQIYDDMDLITKIKDFCSIPRTATEIRQFLGIKSKSYVGEKILKPLIKSNVLEYTNKKSINARNQKYCSKKTK